MKGVARLMTAVVLLGFVVLVTIDATGIAQEEKKFQQDKDQAERAEAQKPDAKVIATGNMDGSIDMWEASSGEHIRVLEGCTGAIEELDFSPDSSKLAAATGGDGVGIWDLGVTGGVQELSTSSTQHVAFLPDSRHLFMVGPGKSQVWDQATGTCLFSLDIDDEDEFPGPLLSPDGRRIFVARQATGQLLLLDAHDGDVLAQLRSEMGPIHTVFFSPDGRSLSIADTYTLAVYRRRRPEWWWGIFWLWEFWLTAFFAVAFILSVACDRRRFRALIAAAD